MPRKGPNPAKANATTWKKGQPSPNPGGKPRLPDDIREARKLNQVELERTINRYLFASIGELRELAEDETGAAMDVLVAALITRAVESGDPTRFELILNRLIGKVTEKVEVKLPTPFVVQRSDGSQVVAGFAPPKEET